MFASFGNVRSTMASATSPEKFPRSLLGNSRRFAETSRHQLRTITDGSASRPYHAVLPIPDVSAKRPYQTKRRAILLRGYQAGANRVLDNVIPFFRKRLLRSGFGDRRNRAASWMPDMSGRVAFPVANDLRWS